MKKGAGRPQPQNRPKQPPAFEANLYKALDDHGEFARRPDGALTFEAFKDLRSIISTFNAKVS